MSKKVQKTLTAALATTLATGSMTIPAMADTKESKANIDDLYKAAYEATIKTQDLDTVTQADINVAREAIDALRGTSVENAVPTFSSIVDKAQQKFLEVAYNSIVKCQETGTQKDINTARTNIKDLPLEFKNPYSMAIDVVQQKVIDKVYAAVEEAIKSQKPEDIKKAQGLLDDILTVVENDGVKKWAVDTEVRFKKATAVLNIVSAEALNNNTVRVVFNRPVDAKSVIADNFSVTPKDEAYNNLIVNTAKVAEDGMSVDLTTINTFANKTDYVVNASNLKDTFGNAMAEKAHAEFNYTVAKVKSIEFSTKNVPLSANLKNYVVIKDDLGRNVTNQYKDKLTFTTSNTDLVNTDGVVTSDEPKEGENHVMVGVTVDGTGITTSAALTVTKLAATTFQGYAIVENEAHLDKTFSQLSKDEQLEYVTVGQKNTKLVVGFKNQEGEEIPLDESDFTVEENYNPTVAIVSNDGSIQALSEGTAYIRIKCGDIEKTVSIQVKAAALPSTISTSKDNYNLVAKNKDGININYTINNQFGNRYNGNEQVTTNGTIDTSSNSQTITDWTVKNSSGNIVNSKGATGDNAKDLSISLNASNNQFTITPLDGVKTGTYTVTVSRKFSYKGNDTTITKALTINVVNGGTLAGYQVQLSNDKLDVNPPKSEANPNGNENGTPNTATVTVYRVDAQGNELGTVQFADKNKDSDASLEILDSNGNNAETEGDVSVSGNVITALSDGIYTVKVKVGTYVTKQITLTIVNTKSKPTAITLNSKTTTLDKASTIEQILKNVGCTVKDQFGKTLDNKLVNINYTVANESGAAIKTVKDKSLEGLVYYTGTDKDGNDVNQGNLDLVINSIGVEDGNSTKTIYFNTPLLIKVTANSTATDDSTVTPEETVGTATIKDGYETILNSDRTPNIEDISKNIIYTYANGTTKTVISCKATVKDKKVQVTEITLEGNKVVKLTTPLEVSIKSQTNDEAIKKAKDAAADALKIAQDATKDLNEQNVTVKKATIAVNKATIAVDKANYYKSLAGSESKDAILAVNNANAQLEQANKLMSKANEYADTIKNLQNVIQEDQKNVVNIGTQLAEAHAEASKTNDWSNYDALRKTHEDATKLMINNIEKLIVIPGAAFVDGDGNNLTKEILNADENKSQIGVSEDGRVIKVGNIEYTIQD